MPVNRPAPLVRREPLGGAYFILTFRHTATSHEARAGQFVMLKAGLSAAPPLRRPISILAVDREAETFSVFVKAVGQGSHALSGLQPGELAQCLGPLGTPFNAPPAGTQALLAAGGYGVAPFYFFARTLANASSGARLFYGGRSAADLPLLPRLRELGIPVTAATEDGSLGEHGRVTLPLERHLDGSGAGTPTRLYACGPEPMMHAVARIAAARGLAAEVSLDAWMGCGVGTCLGCVVRIQDVDEPRPKYRCACTEGPVFDAARVVWPGDDASHARRVAAGDVPAAGARG